MLYRVKTAIVYETLLKEIRNLLFVIRTKQLTTKTSKSNYPFIAKTHLYIITLQVSAVIPSSGMSILSDFHRSINKISFLGYYSALIGR